MLGLLISAITVIASSNTWGMLDSMKVTWGKYILCLIAIIALCSVLWPIILAEIIWAKLTQIVNYFTS